MDKLYFLRFLHGIFYRYDLRPLGLYLYKCPCSIAMRRRRGSAKYMIPRPGQRGQ